MADDDLYVLIVDIYTLLLVYTLYFLEQLLVYALDAVQS